MSLTTGAASSASLSALRKMQQTYNNDGGLDNDYNSSNPNTSTDEVCYEFQDASTEKDLGDFCIANIYIGQQKDPFICLAAFSKHPKQRCLSCDYTWNVCNNGGLGSKGYRLDCSNIFPGHKSMAVCGDRVYMDDTSSWGGNGGYHGSSGGYQTSYNHNNNNGGAIVLRVVIYFAIFVGLILMKAVQASTRQDGASSPSRNAARYNRVAPRDPPQIQMSQLRALQSLPDTHRSHFAFYSVLTDEDYPLAHQLVETCQKGDWQTIKKVLTTLRDRMNKKHAEPDSCVTSISTINNERALCAHIVIKEIEKSWAQSLTDDSVFCSWLDEWCKIEPDNPDALWLRLNAKIAWAWNARSARLARDVSRRQFDAFFDRLKQGKQDLEQALKIFPPHDPIIYSGAFTLARGLQQSHEVVNEYLEKLEATADPYHVPAHFSALQYHCQKWHGSHDLMFRYARKMTQDLPEGHSLWALIPMAHWERTLLMHTWAERALFRSQHPELRNELLQAYNQALGETDWVHGFDPSLSIADKWFHVIMRNWFLEQLFRYGQIDQARSQICVIGKRPTESCWFHLDNYKFVLDRLGYDVVEGEVPEAPLVTAQVV